MKNMSDKEVSDTLEQCFVRAINEAKKKGKQKNPTAHIIQKATGYFNAKTGLSAGLEFVTIWLINKAVYDLYNKTVEKPEDTAGLYQ